MGTEKSIIKDSKGSGGIVGITNQKYALCLPVEIFMRQGGRASISKGSVMVSLKWFTNAWTCSSSRFKAVCFISSCEITCGSFNGIWSDMGTEKTIIKDSKGSGGIV
jgi:hypothetical protein